MHKKCLDCNNIIEPRKQRCLSCAKKRRDDIYKRSFIKRNTTGVRHITAVCTVCKKEYKRDKYSKGNPFCTSACRGQFRYEQKQLSRNKQFNLGKLKYRRRIRHILLRQQGHVCKICNNTQWNEQPIPLQVDHVDGNAANNQPCNLRLICHNCDALLPTFAGKNKGKGRKSRGLKTYE